MTAEAKAIYEAILENGPLDTVRLRREARMSAESAKSRFDRRLVELQVGLKVLPIGVARTGAWNYAFTYELFRRWVPEVPEQGPCHQAQRGAAGAGAALPRQRRRRGPEDDRQGVSRLEVDIEGVGSHHRSAAGGWRDSGSSS
jgi:hypothetical protein